MNENAKNWVDALRSGEYEQGYNALKRDDVYCCLGVACDLFTRDTGLGEWSVSDAGTHFQVGEGERTAGVLPVEVRDWLGLVTKAGDYDDGRGCLAAQNDAGATFNEIADVIESRPDGLFTTTPRETTCG